MDIFTIITEIFSLFFSALGIYISYTGNKQQPYHKTNILINNPIIQVNTFHYIPRAISDSQSDSDNTNFKKSAICHIIYILFLIILIVNFIHAWNNLDIDAMALLLPDKLKKIVCVLYYSLFVTLKAITPPLFILCIGWIIKNIKTPATPYRIFNILSNSLVALFCIMFFISLFIINYTLFLSNTNTASAFPANILIQICYLLPILENFLVLVMNEFIAKILLLGIRKSAKIHENFSYIKKQLLFVISLILICSCNFYIAYYF